MADVSSPPDSTPAKEEGELWIEVTLDDLRNLINRGTRLHGGVSVGEMAYLQVAPGRRHRWHLRNETVSAWFTGETITHGVYVTMGFPWSFLSAVATAFHDGVRERIALRVGTDRTSVRVQHDGATFTSMAETRKEIPQTYFGEAGDPIVVQVSDVRRLARTLSICPVAPLMLEMLETPKPFVTVSCRDGLLTATRDWGAFDGGTVSIAVPAEGSWSRTVQFDAEMFLDDLALIDGSGTVSLTLLTHCPRILQIDSGGSGYFVQLENQLVTKYRQTLEDLLLENGFDHDYEMVEDDSNQLLNVFVGDDSVQVHVIGSGETGYDMVRVDLVACDDVESNDFIAQELNSWNSSLEGIKVLHIDRRIVVRHEFPAQNLEQIISQLPLVQETAEGVRMVREVFT